MASVRKKPNSLYWYACYQMPTGENKPDGTPRFKQVQRSTGLEDRERAMQMAISFERAARAAAEKRWTENAAQRFLTEIRAVTGVDAGQVEPLEPFLHRWVTSRKGSIDERTLKKYQDAIDLFIEWLGHRAKGTLADISPAVVAKFRDAQTTKGKSAATVNKALMILGQAFQEAVTLGILTTNPARGLNVKGAKKQAQKRRAFTFDQFRELVAACDGEWKTLVLICGYTGARQQEAAHLHWSQVDLAGKRLTLERTKTGDEHWLPIHPALVEHLVDLSGDRRGAVMPEMHAAQRRAISNNFRRAILPRIGIKQEYSKGRGEGRKLAEYSLHSLRHSLSTWLNAAGVSELMRMRIVGHENEEVSRGYTHTEFIQLAGEVAKLPSV